MNLIEFIFRIISHFVPISNVERESMKSDAREWDAQLDIKSKNKIISTYVTYRNEWYVKLFLALMFWPASRMFQKYIVDFAQVNSQLIDDPDEDENLN